MTTKIQECRHCRNVMVGPDKEGRLGIRGCFFNQPCYQEAANCAEFISRSWIPVKGDKNADS